MEGDETCREYARTPSFWMGTSRLAPGTAGEVDVGHAEHAEMFLVMSGSARVSTGEDIYELGEGDAVFIPPGIPHTLRNIGASETVVVWAAGLDHKA
jgi:mannose-6-phosphate isomerase-like protein (cupin superfamily)